MAGVKRWILPVAIVTVASLTLAAILLASSGKNEFGFLEGVAFRRVIAPCDTAKHSGAECEYLIFAPNRTDNVLPAMRRELTPERGYVRTGQWLYERGSGPAATMAQFSTRPPFQFPGPPLFQLEPGECYVMILQPENLVRQADEEPCRSLG